MKFGFMMLMLMFAGAANAASVREQEGNIFYVGDDGVTKQLTSLHIDSEPLLSPDGQKVVFYRAKQEKIKDDRGWGDKGHESELWLSDVSGNEVHRILDAQPDDDPKKNLTYFNSAKFSADSKLLYFLTEAWATSNALHVLDMASGNEHFITDADDVLVIDKGKYANHLIVLKHKYFDQGGSYDYYWLITPQGKEIRKVGEDDEQAKRFVRKQEGKR